MSRYPVAAFVSLILVGFSGSHGQDPPRPQVRGGVQKDLEPPVPSPKPGPTTTLLPPVLPPAARHSTDFPTATDEIKPLPLVAIPDDPPPHEGAMFDIPVTIDPPDILTVEVLEGLAGMPITGQHLVRPDGTIGLGFYGDVHVRGLTEIQAKVKIITHLRTFLQDEPLGLVRPAETVENPDDGVKPGVADPADSGPPRSPFNLALPIVPTAPPASPIDPAPAKPVPPSTERSQPTSQNRTVFDRSNSQVKPLTAPQRIDKAAGANLAPNPVQVPEAPHAGEVPPPSMLEIIGDVPMIRVPPALSNRVFVELSSYNSKVYYVQGHVGSPGRVPWTGHDTVLDALNYARGIIPSGDPEDIHLYRPARGGRPRTVYKIDYGMIMNGEAPANLQLFPGDRLVIGANPQYKKQLERQ